MIRVMSDDTCFTMIRPHLEVFAVHTDFYSVLMSMPVSRQACCQLFPCCSIALLRLSAVLPPFLLVRLMLLHLWYNVLLAWVSLPEQFA